MKFKISLFAFYFTTTLSTIAHATVGGPETIELLGYDKADQKIYFTRHFQDETGRLPTLYYFVVNNTKNHNPIEVKSIYKKFNQKQNQEEYELALIQIDTIKKRLLPLTTIPHAKSLVHISKSIQRKGYFWKYHPDYSVNQYVQNYTIHNQTLKSQTHSMISYQNNNYQIKGIYALDQPSKPIQIAIIEYLGIPEETGYLKQDAILLRP